MVPKNRKLNYNLENRWEYNLHFNYGLAKGEYEKLLQKQDGVCAICRGKCPSGRRLAVDHDHETGSIRGLLCGPCNTAIGKLGECTDRMIDALLYIISHRQRDDDS